MKLHFTKMEGLGNDYIYIDGINQKVPMNKEFITKISDRHFGIGSDGMIVILPSDKYDFKMRMFNLDGSEAMMCGNGIRCFAKFIYDHKLSNKHVLEIETKSGLRIVKLLFDGERCIGAKVNMGKPVLACKEIPCTYNKETMIDQEVEIDGVFYRLTSISMGNPHTVIFVDDLDSLDLKTIGPKFEHHELFPESVNTEFVKVIKDDYVKMRVWERGSGETMACGTGACAVMYASYLNNHTTNKIIVELLGGCLEIEYVDETIMMSGPATNVFEGTIEI